MRIIFKNTKIGEICVQLAENAWLTNLPVCVCVWPFLIFQQIINTRTHFYLLFTWYWMAKTLWILRGESLIWDLSCPWHFIWHHLEQPFKRQYVTHLEKMNITGNLFSQKPKELWAESDNFDCPETRKEFSGRPPVFQHGSGYIPPACQLHSKSLAPLKWVTKKYQSPTCLKSLTRQTGFYATSFLACTDELLITTWHDFLVPVYKKVVRGLERKKNK